MTTDVAADGAAPIQQSPTDRAREMLVPAEATDEIMLAIVRELQRQSTWLGWEPTAIWKAALAAAQPAEADGVAEFIAEIHARTPEGQWINVQHHPSGDWSVAAYPNAATPKAPATDAGEVEHGESDGYATNGLEASSGRPEWTGQEPGSTDTTKRLRCENDPNRRADTSEQVFAPAGCDGPEDTATPPAPNDDLRAALEENERLRASLEELRTPLERTATAVADTVSVTQEQRDAAADVLALFGYLSGADRVRRGLSDIRVAALASTQPAPAFPREEAAKIIDPAAWEQRDRHLNKAGEAEHADDAHQWFVRADDVVAASLRTADRLEALLQGKQP